MEPDLASRFRALVLPELGYLRRIGMALTGNASACDDLVQESVLRGLRYFGSYSNQVDPGLGSNTTIMNAFLKGRAAISAKDLDTKTAQASVIQKCIKRRRAINGSSA